MKREYNTPEFSVMFLYEDIITSSVSNDSDDDYEDEEDDEYSLGGMPM